jgi:MinD-like ATPase involved in chromosome partitioning or flagellar assembly
MRTITFYSYKGGLGRSLMLAWCARRLAAEGRRVVALDLDLEAPGLHYKLLKGRAVDGPAAEGVVGLLRGFLRGDPAPQDLTPWTTEVPTDGPGSLRLLSAGSAPSPEYWRDLLMCGSDALFRADDAEGLRFFIWLKEKIESSLRPDYLLIDARTGVTEMGGVALAYLADEIVALTSYAEESRNGLRAVLRAATATAARGSYRSVQRLHAVLARIPFDPARYVDDAVNLKAFMEAETEDLASVPSVASVSIVRAEDALHVNELRAFVGARLTVHDDYAQVLRRFTDVGSAADAPTGASVVNDAPRVSSRLRAAEESLELAQAAATIRGGDSPNLVRALLVLAREQRGDGRTDEAVNSLDRALALLLPIDDSVNPMVVALRAEPLTEIANDFRANGLVEMELIAARAAVAAFRTAAALDPNRHARGLARALVDLSFRLESEEVEGAIAAISESIDVLKGLGTGDGYLTNMLVTQIRRLAFHYERCGELAVALRFADEIVDIVGRAGTVMRRENRAATLAMASSTRARLLEGLGRTDEARRALTDAAAQLNPPNDAAP